MSNLVTKAGNKLVISLALLLMFPMYTLLYIIKKLEIVKDRYSVKQRYLRRLRQEREMNRTSSAMA
ncbi:MAG: hypothetical protein DI535_21330 [Citrobacter freundii]|nr:MAG: hypothetical protein DI535_21330 [Citrobacter freundii]